MYTSEIIEEDIDISIMRQEYQFSKTKQNQNKTKRKMIIMQCSWGFTTNFFLNMFKKSGELSIYPMILFKLNVSWSLHISAYYFAGLFDSRRLCFP